MGHAKVGGASTVLAGLRRLVSEYDSLGVSRRRLALRSAEECETPISESQISRLMSETATRGLSLEAAESLAYLLGYEIVLKPIPKSRR